MILELTIEVKDHLGCNFISSWYFMDPTVLLLARYYIVGCGMIVVQRAYFAYQCEYLLNYKFFKALVYKLLYKVQ